MSPSEGKDSDSSDSRKTPIIFIFLIVLYIFLRHRVCLFDPADLIGRWWEGFGSSPLATLPLGFNCGFILTSACGLSPGVCS